MDSSNNLALSRQDDAVGLQDTEFNQYINILHDSSSESRQQQLIKSSFENPVALSTFRVMDGEKSSNLHDSGKV